jgi:HAD superfamily phosphatase (TIGR01668 family)
MLKHRPAFQRDAAPKYLRRFCPDYHVTSIEQISPEDLVEHGVKGVLLDLDNTLLPWKSSDIPASTLDWIASCKKCGLKLCLVSNTRNLPRLEAIAKRMDIAYIRGKMKPSRDGFRRGLEMIGCTAKESVMIGDQMFTDIWGGNRAGTRTIWVEKMAPREFIGTRVSRVLERIVLRMLRQKS